jgi:TetR/AcrR family transcriptional regulator of autoinduction and epiphytic fitness
VERAVRQLEEVFAPELRAAGRRRDAVLKGMFVAASWTTWLLLRDDFAMSPRDCTDVMRSTISVLLGG